MNLLISCPNCQTSYQISEEQVHESGGQAQCSQCNTVFNALLNSQPLPDNEIAVSPGETDFTDRSVPSEIQDFTEDFSEELGDYLEESQLSSIFEQDDDSKIFTNPDEIPANSPAEESISSIIDLDELDDLPTLSTADKAPDIIQQPTTPAGSMVWTVGILILTAAAILQFSWLNRSDLIKTDQGRAFLNTVCDYAGCKLPVRRSVKDFQIIERQLNAHPEVKGILQLQMLFANKAEFDQPAPGVSLSLFDSRQKIVSRRSFNYENYMNHFSRKAPMIKAGQVQKVSLNLEDPGADVTGFEFNFF